MCVALQESAALSAQVLHLTGGPQQGYAVQARFFGAASGTGYQRVDRAGAVACSRVGVSPTLQQKGDEIAPSVARSHMERPQTVIAYRIDIGSAL